METVYSVRTPENVDFHFTLAGPARRMVAWGLDILGIALLTALASWIAFLIANVGSSGLANALFAAIFFLINWGYFVFWEWYWRGQSPGKRLMKLRVIQDTGVKLTFFQSTIRNLLRLIDFLPLLYLVGGTLALFHGSHKRLGDIAAGTIVIRETRHTLPSVIVPARERYNSFVQDSQVIALARSRVTLEEREVMTSLALRREELALDVRLDLFRQMAQHLQRKLGLVKPEVFSEEKFVLNLTAVLLAEGEGSQADGVPDNLAVS